MPATSTPTPAPSLTAPPPPEPVGTVAFYESSITLPVYPVGPFQSDGVDPVFNWPFRRTDMAAFAAAAPAPVARTYRTLVLENEYLLITILPEIGGRILQVEFKPTGARVFYNNSVVKPTAWGPPAQSGWTALGGLEWCLPVEEHGYAWGEPWGYIPLPFSTTRAAVTVFTPQDGRALNARVTVELLAGASSFTIEPTLTNRSGAPLRFHYWHNAMLAPGDGAGVTPGIHFVLPATQMIVHSTGDPRLPAAGQRVAWPIYGGRDLSRLATWRQYAGLFEMPAAHGPFAAVYDTQQDAGVVRIFPADVAQGSKIFALGGTQPLDPALYTDNGSAYVELHAGLAPTFAQQTSLPAAGAVTWRETWYPVSGLGDLTVANELLAINVQPRPRDAAFGVALHAVHPLSADIVLLGADGAELARRALTLTPRAPVRLTWAAGELAHAPAALRVENAQGLVLAYTLAGE